MKPCVIEIQDNAVIGLSICQDAKQAREVFTSVAKENTDLTAEEIEAALDGGGVVTVGDGSVCLFGGHEFPPDKEDDS